MPNMGAAINPPLLDRHGRPLTAARRYEGAAVSRRTADWTTSSTGPNQEIHADLVTLRNRHRVSIHARPIGRAIVGHGM